MKSLVTGGAGYIGSFMVKRLLDEGADVVVLDSLERGHKEAVDKRADLRVGSLLDREFIKNLFLENYDVVFHFAAYISMGESVKDPSIYLENNVQSSLNLLQEMKISHQNNIIFSSTAGVYGDPLEIPIPEQHRKMPNNPYGESKLLVESILDWYNKAHGINFVALRYFNAAGASLDGTLGEGHNPETHIIPVAIDSLLNNKEFPMYGTDYRTDDGTAVRDYIHVLDLIEAHMLAYQKLERDKGGYFYNVGTGRGYSNKEIILEIEAVSGKRINITEKDRRLGDAPMLVADPSKINEELGFQPKYSDIKTIIDSAWKYHTANA